MIRPLFRHAAAGSALLALAMAMVAAPAGARETPLSIRNSFRIGNAGVLCTAQNTPADTRLSGIFDRAYRLSCRDAAGAIGTLLATRAALPLTAAPSGVPGAVLQCGAETRDRIDTLGDVAATTCHDERDRVDYRRYAVRRGNVTYMVEGLAGYEPALRLALASVVADRAVPGEIRVATTEVTDTAAFARVQAGQLDKLGVRDEGYLRNNGGRYAESAEFFESLALRNTQGGTSSLAEALANQGLQQSNLGNFAASGRLFDESAAVIARGDGVAQRLLRNYRAIDRLNQHQPDKARAALAVSVDPVSALYEHDALARGFINTPLSEQINRENATLKELGGIDPGLTPAEKAEILDAQAMSIAATTARMEGRLDEAAQGLAAATKRLDTVREGRVVSVNWLRAENAIELALVEEARGDRAAAGAAYDQAIGIFANNFPDSPALLAADARKAAFLARGGDAAGARMVFAQVVEDSAHVPDSGTTLRDLLGPYFALLSTEGDGGAAAMFAAAQVMQRPGVAQTQAVLAREMSEGNDDAAALFRLSLARTRDIARAENEVARLAALPGPTPREVEQLAAARDLLASLRTNQTELVSKLSAFPRYKVIAPERVPLADLGAALRPGEAYYKMVAAGDDLYALFVTPAGAQSFRLPLGRAQLASEVQAVRDSIMTIEKGKVVNRPFDLDRSRALYHALFDPVEAAMTGVHHLVFEPDAAMLQLPPTVLVTDDAGIAAYKARAAKADADPFDFTGVAWLGRGREVSIAVSPRGFIDLRKLAPSRALRPYLGLGHNAVPRIRPLTAAVADECDWPLLTWQRPISADELVYAQQRMGPGSALRTDASFSDSALLGDSGLDQYRVLHFATHGLVTAPRPDCPARPALVTSFGGKGSDGLLSFREIFDLQLDADLVILSACDTAGMATISASREAGVTSGGNYALDGLVRAFVGAGARSVIASHWPVPDDFDATKRLIGGVIDTTPGKPLAEALAAAQAKLMDDPDTSHPFYWAAFVIVGDGAKPLVSAAAAPAGGPGTAR